MEFKQGGAYNSKKSQKGGASASGYARKRKDAQDDYFYGDFKSKDDFYDFFSSTAKEKR